jgi:hypothetical protein
MIRNALTSLHQRLVKTGERLVKHVYYYWWLLAEEHLTRQVFWQHAANDRGAAAAGRLGTRGENDRTG